MINSSYNQSQTIHEMLDKIELVRRKLLLTVVSTKDELHLKWQATIHRVYYSLHLSNNPLPKERIEKLLTNEKEKKLFPSELEVLRYKKALDTVYRDWHVTPALLVPKTLTNLHQEAMQGGRLQVPELDVKKLLDYLQSSKDHPLVQAASAYIGILKLRPYLEGNARLARLCSLLFIYKAGYDCRGLLVLEEEFASEKSIYDEILQTAIKDINITPWLEYFLHSAYTNLQKGLAHLVAASLNQTSLKPQSDRQEFWELNDRQRDILIYLEQPFIKMTNRKVQNLFKISQITASRDLAKLASLGLLFAHGKGRSVYYTRV